MGIPTFIQKFIKFNPVWNGTPEMFLAIIMEMQSRTNNTFSAQEVVHWGEVMQKVVNVNLTPYKNFSDLMKNGVPDFSRVELLRKNIDQKNQRVELKKAIYGAQADLGDDDLINSNSSGAIFTRKMLKALSKHVRFSDEDQNMIDNFRI